MTMNTANTFLDNYDNRIGLTPVISINENLDTSSFSLAIDIDKKNERRIKRNNRERKRQQHLQKLLKRIEDLVNINKPNSKHVFSEREVLGEAIKMITRSEDLKKNRNLKRKRSQEEMITCSI